jgi:energy-coupling factor transporter ATP-binding protein EcfA2
MKFWNPFRAVNAVTAVVAQHFHSLSPIEDADVAQYEEALLWALRNRKKQDIKNVALTGPYGSGKSSIIKTFQRNHKNEFSFLNISLATFKEELLDEEHEQELKKNKPQDKDLLRLIELSILQQIFYHEEDSAIPDSRFKKIRSFKRSNLIMIAASILLLVLCGFNLLAPEKFKNEFHLELGTKQALILHMVSWALLILGTYIILLRSIRLLNSIKISKFKFHDTEIEVDKSISKSILNNHVDELLYFFEVTPYTVVIIEDLDRFQQTEIFTKLRELNLLINNSKKVKRDIVFIYAVRDDMFQDKDRTKFFDFIIPVIPVINSSNSNNKLLKIVQENDYNISDDLIDDIGLFVDDMRLLYNITNEYHLYKGLLDKKLSQNKLLSMIVYKNIFPNDFVKLSNRDGELYKVFANKQTRVGNLQKQIDEEIEALKEEVKRLSELKITDIKDLRMLYLVRYPKHLQYFHGFYHIDTQYSLEDVADAKLFQLLIDKKLRYNNFVFIQWGSTYNLSNALVDIDFKTIEKEVDTKRTYEERVAEITKDSDSNIAALRRQIIEKEKKKTSARHLKLKELMATGALKIEIEDKKKSLLLNVLMRAGHIDEEYLDYISIFYEGSITKDDRDFLLNVKSQIATDFDFQLRHLEKLVPKIGMNDFEQAYTLNYSLLDFLLTDKKYDSHTSVTLQLLKLASKESLKFIDGFIDNAVNIEEFINKTAKAWPQFWHVISQQSAYSDERKFKYLDYIISYADLEDIEKMAKDSNLRSALMGRQSLLSDLTHPEKLESVIAALKIKFSDIILADAPQSSVDYIHIQNAYELTETMVRRVIQAKGIYDENSFDKANYEAIQTSEAASLITYVSENIPQYVAMIYLTLAANTLEPEETLIELLNKEDLEIEDKKAILDKTTAIITRLDQSISSELDALLLHSLRVAPVWDNILNNFEAHENALSDQAIVFLNHLPNAEALSKDLITNSESSIESEHLLIAALLKTSSITANAFEFLVKSIPEIDPEPDFAEIDEDHTGILIENDLVLLSPENFASLKTNFESQHVGLAERQTESFIADIENYALDTDDLIKLLRSDKFDIGQKLVMLYSVDEDIVIVNTTLLTIVGRLAIANIAFKLKKKTLTAVLTKTLTLQERIKLFNMNFISFSSADVTTILQLLPPPYSEIAIKGRRPLLPYSEENNYFVNNLKTLRYISKQTEEKKGIRISTYQK